MKLNIEIDDSLRAFLEQQAVEGGYGSQAQYIQSLIEDDRERLAEQALEQKLLLEIAHANGDVTDDDHDRVRQQVREPRLQELREMLREGIEQADRGEFVEFTVEDIMREGRELLARRKREGKKDGEAA
jgi:Arc/MetJ-type ribon-helix-helix transcriptional regulator